MAMEAPQAEFDNGASYRNEGPSDQSRPEAGTEQLIAYTHGLSLRLPKEQIEPLMLAHIEACNAAGPATCLVTNSNINKQSDDYVNGTLYIRATEDWITSFNTNLDGDLAKAEGEVTSRTKSAEDLTSIILDTDARLKAQITLQGRLEDLLARRDGKLADLLEIERELARVTGTVESITANLKALRMRVSLSQFSVNYTQKTSPVAASRFNPLGAAFGDFFYNLSSGLADVINAFAVLLPWMVLIGILLFLWLRMIWPWVRKKRSKT